jgi:hypothetical protein
MRKPLTAKGPVASRVTTLGASISCQEETDPMEEGEAAEKPDSSPETRWGWPCEDKFFCWDIPLQWGYWPRK